MRYDNGVLTTFAYDAAREWLDGVETADGTQVLFGTQYTHDAGGRITRALSADARWSYSYDAFDRLTLGRGRPVRHDAALRA